MKLTIQYFLSEIKAQLISVGPITLFLTLFFIASRQRNIDDFWETVLGMLCAAVGLTLFLFGLKGSIMPLAEKVGKLVNEKFSLWVVLTISFVLGVLVTLAEPAVSALRPLGEQVDRTRAPYLYYMINDGVDLLLFSIGVGVGIAAVIGTARFVYRWPFKPIAIASAVLCLVLSALVYFLVEDLRVATSLAWDAGAVTTGPVTVPILLALGKGAVANQSNARPGPPMQGFGLVTLASIYPIICVHIYGLILIATVDRDSIISSEPSAQDSAAETPPLREVVTAIRSIAPLSAALILILKVLLRADLPSVTMKDVMSGDASQASACATEVTSPEKSQSALSIMDPTGQASSNSDYEVDDVEANETAEMDSPMRNVPTADTQPGTPELNAEGKEDKDDSKKTEDVDKEDGSSKVTPFQAFKNFMGKEEIFFFALLSAQVGLILFNIGLHYGFSSLGAQVGSLLPAFYREIEDDPDSPLLNEGAGTFVAYLFIFCLAILATRAEPGLKVLAEQVKSLTNSEMKRKTTVYSVALGVGIGMVAGASRLQLAASIFPYLATMYAVAVVATIFSPEMVAKVAWDSAGVTTGPVTVPFVLSIGLAYAKALVLPGGFGILACASVGPIISVLLVSFASWKRPSGAGGDW